jgi:hypothetical protein
MGISAARDAFLYPTLTFVFSMEDTEGINTALTLSHSADLRVKLGYDDEKHNGYHYALNQSVLAYLEANLSLPFVLPCGLSATPMVEHTSLLDSDVREAIEIPSNFRFGLAPDYSFI